MSSREKGQADFDLERFIDMFDEALTSKDERVVNALQSLMMMVILTKSETSNPMSDKDRGPLRQLFEDMHNLNRRQHEAEERLRRMEDYSRKSQDPRDQWLNDHWKYEAQKYTLRNLDAMNIPVMSEDDYKHLQSALVKINKP